MYMVVLKDRVKAKMKNDEAIQIFHEKPASLIYLGFLNRVYSSQISSDTPPINYTCICNHRKTAS
jgi:hypothetical protein